MTTAPKTHALTNSTPAHSTPTDSPRTNSTPTDSPHASIGASADAGRTAPTFAVPGGPAPGFPSLLRSELGRLMNLRSTWVYAVVILGAMAGLPVLMWALTQDGPPEFMYEPTFPQLLIGNDIAMIVAIIFAAAGSASEISGRRVAFGYLSSKSRVGVHLARMLAQVIIVAAVIVVGFAVVAAILAAVGALVPESLALAATIIGLALLWTAFGSAIGMLIPFTAAAVGVPLAWMLVVEIAVSSVPIEFFATLSKYLPLLSTRVLSDMMDIGVSNLHAGLVLAAWSVALIGGGLLVASRRDVK